MRQFREFKSEQQYVTEIGPIAATLAGLAGLVGGYAAAKKFKGKFKSYRESQAEKKANRYNGVDIEIKKIDPETREEYTFEQIENAETGDEIWNAAQRQLVRSGHIDNYLRMLWGKRILEWAPNPQKAAEWMININDRWALDGRDPNSYTGIFWVLGRHDRAWGPERPIFGKVRYMSSQNTRKKLHLERYLARWAEDAPIPK